jgi:hypothetical protein
MIYLTQSAPRARGSSGSELTEQPAHELGEAVGNDLDHI